MRRTVRTGGWAGQGIGAGTVTLTGLMHVTRGGRRYCYLRVKGKPLVRLPDLPPDHPDFLAAYAAARKASPAAVRAVPGTIAALCEAAMRSEAWRTLSPGYRALLRRHIDAIRDQGGTARAADLRRRHIEADLAALSPHPARARLKAWRFVATTGVAAGLLLIDPTTGVKPPRAPQSAGHPDWTAEEVARFRAHWPIGSVSRAIFELLHWTGCRIGDAVRLGAGMVDRAGVLAFAQDKTGGMAYVPWTCALPDYAEGMSADRAVMHEALTCLAGHLLFLPTRSGKPRSVKAIGGDVTRAARVAGIRKSAHGLRKTRARSLAEAGATTHEIAAWTGHESLKEVEHYTRASNRRRAVMGTERDENSAKHPDPGAKYAG